MMQASLDGYCADASGSNEFIFDGFGPEFNEWVMAKLHACGGHLMGRKTYGDMASYWPTAKEEIAGPMNALPKFVFSKTLREASWGPATILSGELRDEVAKLKAQSGKELIAHGGASFIQALLATGEVDELRLVEHPIALGDGLKIFGSRLALRRTAVEPLGKVVAKTYTRM